MHLRAGAANERIQCLLVGWLTLKAHKITKKVASNANRLVGLCLFYVAHC